MWGLQGWQRDAYVRTEEFRNHGPRAPTTWVLVDGRDKIPKSAIEAGTDKDGHPISLHGRIMKIVFVRSIDFWAAFKPH